MISKKYRFWGREKCKVFFTEANLVLMNTKITPLNYKISLYLQSYQVDIWNGFLRYNQICDEKLPLVKIW